MARVAIFNEVGGRRTEMVTPLVSGRTYTVGTASAKAPRQTCAGMFQEFAEQCREMK